MFTNYVYRFLTFSTPPSPWLTALLNKICQIYLVTLTFHDCCKRSFWMIPYTKITLGNWRYSMALKASSPLFMISAEICILSAPPYTKASELKRKRMGIMYCLINAQYRISVILRKHSLKYIYHKNNLNWAKTFHLN